MITSYAEAKAILDADPEIDPDVFWPSVGITRETADAVGSAHALAYGISYSQAMATLESGATLARDARAMA